MKPAPLLVFLPLLLPVYALAARPLAKPPLREDGVYLFKDHGRTLKFRIARDELMESSNGRSKRVPITARDQLRKMQETAKSLSGTGKKMDLVVYPEGKPQTDEHRRTVTNKISVFLDEGIDPTTIGLSVNAKAMTALPYLPFAYVIEFEDALEAITSAEALRSIPGVFRSEVMLGSQMIPCLTPTDPLFATGTANYGSYIGLDYSEDPVNTIGIWTRQTDTRAWQWYINPDLSDIPPVYWHNWKINDLGPFVDPNDIIDLPPGEILRPVPNRRPIFESGKLGLPFYFERQTHLNVVNAWDNVRPIPNGGTKTIDGEGVRVGIIDDGVQLNHSDFNPLKNLISDDRNFLDGDQTPTSTDPRRLDPTPPAPTATAPGVFPHGTMVAGLIRASRNNARGITGIAPNASMAAYRIVGQLVDPAVYANAMAFGANTQPTQITTENPLGIPTGLEWRTGAIKYDICINANSLQTSGRDLLDLDIFLQKAILYGIHHGRVVDGIARGVVYVCPAGNDGHVHGDTNYNTWTNSPYTLTVGSVSDLGRRIADSAPGAAVHVVAPSTGNEMAPRITAGGTLKPAYPIVQPTPVVGVPPLRLGEVPRPDTLQARAKGYALTPDEWDATNAVLRNTQNVITTNSITTPGGTPGYNPNFGGTSAASAMAAGVVALMLEANPRLSYRDVQEILMRSAKIVDPGMGEWSFNPLGRAMSHKYGAGLIDADRAVKMAQEWIPLGPRTGGLYNTTGGLNFKEEKGEIQRPSPNQRIFDNGLLTTISVPAPSPGLRVEVVRVKLKVRHGRRGDLGIVLVAPKNGQADYPMESFLFVPHREDEQKNIGMPDEPDNGGDRGIKDGEYYTFTTVRHWGTSSTQNQSLVPDIAYNTQPWSLVLWDNTTKGVVLNPNQNAANPEDRIYVGTPNPPATEIARVEFIEVSYLGTDTPSRNESPIILNNIIVAQTTPGTTPVAGTFRSNVRAETDMTPNTITALPRAPITDYRVRVLDKLDPNSEELEIAPTTEANHLFLYGPLAPDAPSPAHLRFDRTTGQLTNDPYDPTSTLKFRPLKRGAWLLEISATNLFGTTRRQIPFYVRDSLTYNEWKQVEFTPAQLASQAISGNNADPDGDGITNIMEYVMGGRPLLNEPFLTPDIRIEGTEIVVNFQKANNTLAYKLQAQVSNDLQNWTNLTDTEIATDGVISIRRAATPYTPGTNQFLRVRASFE